MVARIHTVAFSGIEVLPIEVQVQVSSGVPAFVLVGLPDKAVAESRERAVAAAARLERGPRNNVGVIPRIF